MSKVTIHKMDVEPKHTLEEIKSAFPSDNNPKYAGRKKTQKTYPRGILKGVKNPTKPPPFKKGTKRHMIRIRTETSSHIKKRVEKMSDKKVRDIAIRSGLSKGKAPISLLRQMVEGGMVTGFISDN